ncbi:MAG: nicotinate (nicotinamide) nucleotide adenylyltransferase [Endomicrobium sp.]|jgi:nicotinate-nucleotide adenylyltransferase|nr:nicotinate (nicotinamide) nucleotide adenylyltransferase [Endomicrobium sp.]
MSKIAIFGGSFDPVHKAHIQISEAVLKTFNLKKLIFVVSYTPPHKDKQYANVKDRVEMLRLATKNLNNVEVSLYEAEKQNIVYSYQTLDYFQKMYQPDEICMVIGSDSLADLPTWKNIDYLASKYKFIVARRPGICVNSDTKYLDRCIFVYKEIANISSSLVRCCLKNNKQEASKMLCASVYNYIIENGLYK